MDEFKRRLEGRHFLFRGKPIPAGSLVAWAAAVTVFAKGGTIYSTRLTDVVTSKSPAVSPPSLHHNVSKSVSESSHPMRGR